MEQTGRDSPIVVETISTILKKQWWKVTIAVFMLGAQYTALQHTINLVEDLRCDVRMVKVALIKAGIISEFGVTQAPTYDDDDERETRSCLTNILALYMKKHGSD